MVCYSLVDCTETLLLQEKSPLKLDATKPPARLGLSASPAFAAAESPLLGWPLIVIIATAFLVVLPWCFQGVPSGHDFEFHLNSWMEVLSQWKQGILYPRWAAMANHGFGEPRFTFYPPASWMLGAALGAILPWKIVPGAYVWIVLTLAGCSMFLLARNWLPRKDAIFAAALYAANPYHLVIVYWRSAFAELLAAAFMPLLVLCVLRSEEKGARIILPLSLLVAAAWLTNLPSAVMVNYSLALLLVGLAFMKRSPRVLLHGAAAVLLGAALAAFYLAPAIYEQKWVDIGSALWPGVRPQDNFLFTMTNDPRHNRFNLLVSMVASAELIALAGAASLAWRRHRQSQPLGWLLAGWALAITLLMFPFTESAWQHLPKLRFMQLPWRWLLCLNVSFALMFTVAWRRWVPRAILGVAMLLVLATVWLLVQPPWWEKASDFPNMVADQQTGRGYEGTDEYLPIDGDAYDVKLNAPLVKLDDDGTAQVRMQRWAAAEKSFTATVGQPGNLVLHLFTYPAWRAEVNGQVVDTDNQDNTGQMLIPVNAGESRVRVTYIRTHDQVLGDIISIVTALLMLAFVRRQRKLLAAG
jgi:6-pyruvoyl-tetrahydropterin synthase related domain